MNACVLATGWRAKPSTFFSELVSVDLVECLDRHFADDVDSLKLSSGEGYDLHPVKGCELSLD